MTESTSHCPQCEEQIHPIPGKGMPTFCPECRFPLVEIAGKYRLEKELGEGGCSKVYLAQHIHLDYDAARVIKILKTEVFKQADVMSKRFRREVQLTSALSRINEHIVHIYDDFGEDPKLGPFYVMEHLKGRPLQEAIADGPMEFQTAFKIFGELCAAMSAAHGASIIHRDLKPDNIFLVARREDPNFVKVLDFGIAKPLQHETDINLTQGALGTPMYMSPEQCLNQSVGAPSDIYAMGIILYEMLTGHNPFNIDINAPGLSALLIFHAHLSTAPTPPTKWRPEIPQAIEEIMLRSLAKAADERPSSVEAFWQELQFAAPPSWKLFERFGTMYNIKLATGEYDDTLMADEMPAIPQEPTAPVLVSSEPPRVPKAPKPLVGPPPISDTAEDPTDSHDDDDDTTQHDNNQAQEDNKRVLLIAIGSFLLLLVGGFWFVTQNATPKAPVPGRSITTQTPLPPVKRTQTPPPELPAPKAHKRAILRSWKEPTKQQRNDTKLKTTKRKPVTRRKKPTVRKRKSVIRRTRGPCGRASRGFRWIYAKVVKPAGRTPKVTFKRCSQCSQRRRGKGVCLRIPQTNATFVVRVQIERYLACQHHVTKRNTRLRWKLKPLTDDMLQEEWYPCLQ